MILCHEQHAEVIFNNGLVLVRHAMHDAAIRVFENAVETIQMERPGLSFVRCGLALGSFDDKIQTILKCLHHVAIYLVFVQMKDFHPQS